MCAVLAAALGLSGSKDISRFLVTIDEAECTKVGTSYTSTEYLYAASQIIRRLLTNLDFKEEDGKPANIPKYYA
ncbi:hypothetical protein F4679DRAFT_535559 [Xylaria curta]|nr:hypothetical protein F4679DRAFT_535559 [Xylaria curta]